MMDLNAIEKRVIEMMLDGLEDARVGYLREQIRSSSVEKRSYTGYGFFTEFRVPETCPLIPGEPSFRLSDVSGISAKLQLGIGFILFVKNGRLSTFEAHTYDEPWPPDPGEITLAYTRKAK
jgi:hypothetical protein